MVISASGVFFSPDVVMTGIAHETPAYESSEGRLHDLGPFLEETLNRRRPLWTVGLRFAFACQPRQPFG